MVSTYDNLFFFSLIYKLLLTGISSKVEAELNTYQKTKFGISNFIINYKIIMSYYYYYDISRLSKTKFVVNLSVRKSNHIGLPIHL